MPKSKSLAVIEEEPSAAGALVLPNWLMDPSLASDILDDVQIQHTPPRLSLDGERFTILEGQTEIEQLGEDIAVRVVHVHPTIQRTQYMEKFDRKKRQSDDYVPPQCWSNNGNTPDKSVLEPLHTECSSCPYRNREQADKIKENSCSQFRNIVVVNLYDDDTESEPLLLRVNAQSMWHKPSINDGQQLNFDMALKIFDKSPNTPIDLFPIEMGFDTSKDANHQLTFRIDRKRLLVESLEEVQELRQQIADNKPAFVSMCTLAFEGSPASEENEKQEEEPERKAPKRGRRTTQKESAASTKAESGAGAEGEGSAEGEPAAGSKPTTTGARRARRTRNTNPASTPAKSSTAERANPPVEKEESRPEDFVDDGIVPNVDTEEEELDPELQGLLGDVDTV